MQGFVDMCASEDAYCANLDFERLSTLYILCYLYMADKLMGQVVNETNACLQPTTAVQLCLVGYR